jgi:hypothetical protein
VVLSKAEQIFTVTTTTSVPMTINVIAAILPHTAAGEKRCHAENLSTG